MNEWIWGGLQIGGVSFYMKINEWERMMMDGLMNGTDGMGRKGEEREKEREKKKRERDKYEEPTHALTHTYTERGGESAESIGQL